MATDIDRETEFDFNDQNDPLSSITLVREDRNSEQIHKAKENTSETVATFVGDNGEIFQDEFKAEEEAVKTKDLSGDLFLEKEPTKEDRKEISEESVPINTGETNHAIIEDEEKTSKESGLRESTSDKSYDKALDSAKTGEDILSINGATFDNVVEEETYDMRKNEHQRTSDEERDNEIFKGNVFVDDNGSKTNDDRTLNEFIDKAFSDVEEKETGNVSKQDTSLQSGNSNSNFVSVPEIQVKEATDEEISSSDSEFSVSSADSDNEEILVMKKTDKTRKEKVRSLEEELQKTKDRLIEEISKTQVVEKDEKCLEYRPILLHHKLVYKKAKSDLEKAKEAKDRVELRLNSIQERCKELFESMEIQQKQLKNSQDEVKELADENTKIKSELENSEKRNRKSSSSSSSEDEGTGKIKELVATINEREVEIEKLKTDKSEEIERLKSDVQSLEKTENKHLKEIESLTSQNKTLQDSVNRLEEKQRNAELSQGKDFENERLKLKDRIKDLEQSLSEKEDFQKKVQSLEQETFILRNEIKDREQKYSEAISTLTDVQKAYGERDLLLEEYKGEFEKAKLQLATVRHTPEGQSSDIRNELLDTKLQLQRLKEGHGSSSRDEMETVAKLNAVLKALEKSQKECEESKKELVTLRTGLENSQTTAKERAKKILDLQTENLELRDCIEVTKRKVKEKDNALQDVLKIIEEEQRRKKELQAEVDLVHSLRDHNKRLEDGLHESNAKLKIKMHKLKVLKKQLKESQESKQESDSILSTLPNLQQKVEEAQQQILKLTKQIEQRDEEERKKKEMEEEEIRRKEEEKKREKEEWVQRMLAANEQESTDEQQLSKSSDESGMLVEEVQDSSQPVKPAQVSSRGRPSHAYRRLVQKLGPAVMNPDYINSYPEGRRATQRMNQHLISWQERRAIHSARTYSEANLNARKPHRPLSSPVYRNERIRPGMSCSEGQFPRVKSYTRSRGYGNDIEGQRTLHFQPRVLVWGAKNEEPAKKLVAVGDRVLVRFPTDAAVHGTDSINVTGTVKYIGGLEDDDMDIHAGLKLDEPVGEHDGKINGKRYFRCLPHHGKMVKMSDIVRVLNPKYPHHARSPRAMYS